MEKAKQFFKREPVFVIAAVCAVASMFAVPPSAEYLGYIDLRVLELLFCLMAAVAGMQAEGSFLVLSQRLLTGKKSMRLLTMTLVMLPFFSSMLITNDVSLITFVPFAVLVLELTGQSHRLAWVVTLQSIAANIGSMLTPVGNPQNLYLSSYYQIPTGSFFAVTVPVVALSFVLLAACCMAEKKQVIEVHFDRREKIHSKSRLTLFAVLFLVSLLAVLHVISSHTALGITVALMLLCARDVLKKVDYWLLATFVCFFIFAGNVCFYSNFFIFAGNIGEIGAVKTFLEGALQQNTMLGAVLSSQIISNVPAAVLLSNFTTDAKGMLLGTNIGGLGTLVASLASLISFKQYIRTPGAKPLRYLGLFTAANAVMLVVLYIFAAICL